MGNKIRDRALKLFDFLKQLQKWRIFWKHTLRTRSMTFLLPLKLCMLWPWSLFQVIWQKLSLRVEYHENWMLVEHAKRYKLKVRLECFRCTLKDYLGWSLGWAHEPWKIHNNDLWWCGQFTESRNFGNFTFDNTILRKYIFHIILL